MSGILTYTWFVDGKQVGEQQSAPHEYDELSEVEPSCSVNGHRVSVVVAFDPPVRVPRGE